MTQLFAVRYSPADGPDSATLVEAENYSDAIAKVLKSFWDIDMDAVTASDLSAVEVGVATDDLFYLNAAGKLIEIHSAEV